MWNDKKQSNRDAKYIRFIWDYNIYTNEINAVCPDVETMPDYICQIQIHACYHTP